VYATGSLPESSASDQANWCSVSDGSSKNAPAVGTPNVPVEAPSVSVDAVKPPVEPAKLPVDAPTIAAIVVDSGSSFCCATGCRAESITAPTAIARPGWTAVTTDVLA
jgi:hypothetical protein